MNLTVPSFSPGLDEGAPLVAVPITFVMITSPELFGGVKAFFDLVSLVPFVTFTPLTAAFFLLRVCRGI